MALETCPRACAWQSSFQSNLTIHDKQKQDNIVHCGGSWTSRKLFWKHPSSRISWMLSGLVQISQRCQSHSKFLGLPQRTTALQLKVCELELTESGYFLNGVVVVVHTGWLVLPGMMVLAHEGIGKSRQLLLKTILSLTGSQCRDFNTGWICSSVLVSVMSLAALFWIFCNLETVAVGALKRRELQ